MAPREATGTFPDQFLTFDYDAAIPLGVPPTLHDPVPVQNHEPGGGGDAISDDVLNGAALGGGAAGEDALNHTGTHSGTSDSSHALNRPPVATTSQVDPLSIDPTVHQASPWSNNDHQSQQHDHQHQHSQHSHHQQQQEQHHHTPNGLMGDDSHGGASSSSVRRRRSSVESSSSSFRPSPVGNSASDAMMLSGTSIASPPLSTGSSILHAASPPTSPLSSGSAAALSSSNRSSSSSSASRRLRSRTTFHLQSVLDSTLSMESESESGGGGVAGNDGNASGSGSGGTATNLVSPSTVASSPLPGLERTFDSAASSLNASTNFEVDSDVEIDDDVQVSSSSNHHHNNNNNNDDEWMSPVAVVSAAPSPNQMMITTEMDDSSSSHAPQVTATTTSDSVDACAGQSGIASSSLSSTASNDSNDSLRIIYRNVAFDGDDPQSPIAAGGSTSDETPEDGGPASAGSAPSSPTSIMLSFGPNTTVADLKYFAERGCIVALLQALKTPRLVTLGTRMLADYAKMSHRRVAVASNRKILEFVQRTMLQVSEQSSDWLGREYAVETVRSLTATEASDRFLMATFGLLNTLALVARGGPFVTHIQENGVRCTVPLASEKARLHACIAIMNLSCGKANKIEIAKIPDVLEAMRDVMLNSTDEARLKATTCIKNLSNADANDAALLSTPGLVEALGHVAAATCSPETGATPCTTNACLALMNLSISKANKHRVFRTPGVMDALMTVLERTTAQGSSTEARIKACSALSNLAIGYDNKIPMFNYPGFVDSILNVIQTDTGEARTKACSILWSFAAEMKNQVPVVQRGDILPVLVRVAEEDGTTEARFKCVAALTLLAESLDNAIPLLEAGALVPLMDILHDAGPDPTQWKGQTASWCVGFLMNIAQSDEAVPSLREAGVVELLAPLLTLDHYQSLKAAMAVTFCCRYDKGDECYDLLRKTENVIPKIISLLHNTLSGRGGNGYKYGVFTLRSSVGCIAALALGPDFMKERVATGPVYESLLRVVTDFCVDGGSPGAIVGGGRDDALSATLAIRALQSLTAHLIPIAGSSALPFGQSMEDRLLIAVESFETCSHPELKDETLKLATDAKVRIRGGKKVVSVGCAGVVRDDTDVDMGDVASMASNCCGIDYLPGFGEEFFHGLMLPSLTKDRPQAPSAHHHHHHPQIVSSASIVAHDEHDSRPAVRTFLLADARTGRRFVVPTDPSGGRSFNDTRVWCYRRGRFCGPGEVPDPNYVWTAELQRDYEDILAGHDHDEQPVAAASSSSSDALVAGILQEGQ